MLLDLWRHSKAEMSSHATEIRIIYIYIYIDQSSHTQTVHLAAACTLTTFNNPKRSSSPRNQACLGGCHTQVHLLPAMPWHKACARKAHTTRASAVSSHPSSTQAQPATVAMAGPRYRNLGSCSCNCWELKSVVGSCKDHHATGKWVENEKLQVILMAMSLQDGLIKA